MILAATKICLQKQEREGEEVGETFGEREAILKETLKVLERQEKFLNGFDRGEAVEVAPGHRIRKAR